MARTVKVNIGGTDYHMPASYKASRQIAEEVGDPLQMAINAQKSGGVDWSQEDVISIIYIGATLAGCSLSRDDLGEAVFEAGLIDYLHIASDYVATIVAGGPEKSKPSQKKAKS